MPYSLCCKHGITLLKLRENMTCCREIVHKSSNSSRILTHWGTLTFHFHYLIGVLDNLVFWLVAEGVSPSLNQVEDLVPDIRFCLLLMATDQFRVNKILEGIEDPDVLGCMSVLSYSSSNTNPALSVVVPKKWGGKSLLSQDNNLTRKLTPNQA